MNQTATVIPVDWHETQKCPTGSVALVPSIGICDVISAQGWRRQISWPTDPDDPSSHRSKWMHVRNLRRLIPR